jgi:hypothetical protein
MAQVFGALSWPGASALPKYVDSGCHTAPMGVASWMQLRTRDPAMRVSGDALSLMVKMLALDPARRISARDALLVSPNL